MERRKRGLAGSQLSSYVNSVNRCSALSNFLRRRRIMRATTAFQHRSSEKWVEVYLGNEAKQVELSGRATNGVTAGSMSPQR